MNFDVDIDLREIYAGIDRLPVALGQRVQGRGLRAAAEVAAQTARSLVQVDTGRLRDSIRVRSVSARVETFRGTVRVPGAQAQLRAGEPYAHLVELGTVHSEAHPFLAPAAMGTSGAQLQAAATAMRREFGRLERDLRSGRTTRTTLRLAAA